MTVDWPSHLLPGPLGGRIPAACRGCWKSHHLLRSLDLLGPSNMSTKLGWKSRLPNSGSWRSCTTSRIEGPESQGVAGATWFVKLWGSCQMARHILMIPWWHSTKHHKTEDTQKTIRIWYMYDSLSVYYICTYLYIHIILYVYIYTHSSWLKSSLSISSSWDFDTV